jgi:DNA-binding LacI/PurR family transcriptional regulator
MLAGALNCAEGDSKLAIRTFAPCNDMTKVAGEIERWGAQGVFGILKGSELRTLVESLSHPIPIVSCGAPSEIDGVSSVTGDFQVYLEKAIAHLLSLRINSIGLFLRSESSDGADKDLINKFAEKTQSAKVSTTSLSQSVSDAIVTNPDADVCPVPEPLATWLQGLPRPAGIICPSEGGGSYLARCCSALGLKVPEDISIVATDEADLSLFCDPPLTSIVPSMEELGSEAVRMLVGILQGKETQSRRVRIGRFDTIVRESTGSRHHSSDIAAALQYIRTHATRGISVEQVIKETQRVSVPTFHKQFLAATGKSAAQAIRERQVQEVCRLLTETDLPVGTISDLSGFSCPNAMNRTFRADEFMNPREYRKRHKKA